VKKNLLHYLFIKPEKHADFAMSQHNLWSAILKGLKIKTQLFKDSAIQPHI
jgi:hypothetical protein